VGSHTSHAAGPRRQGLRGPGQRLRTTGPGGRRSIPGDGGARRGYKVERGLPVVEGECKAREFLTRQRRHHQIQSYHHSMRMGQPLPSTLSSVAGGAKRRGAQLTPLLVLGRAWLCRSRGWWSPRRPATLAPIVYCEPISGTSARGRRRLARNSREIMPTLPTRTRRHAAQRQAFDPPFRLADGCPGPRHRAPTAVWRVCLSGPKCAPGPPYRDSFATVRFGWVRAQPPVPVVCSQTGEVCSPWVSILAHPTW